ncbi:hypothetical protein [Streptomyces sp. MBT55]|uniref:hypothetical protein n=1 Tax=Streptomyces sp. MBT55 TaxID=1488386 RepID=UPI001F42CD0E|nr:hypothetical protein [Streptomyces sp. MBT55]
MEYGPCRASGSQILRRADAVLDVHPGDVGERSQPVQQFGAKRPPTGPALPPVLGAGARIVEKTSDDQGGRSSGREHLLLMEKQPIQILHRPHPAGRVGGEHRAEDVRRVRHTVQARTDVRQFLPGDVGELCLRFGWQGADRSIRAVRGHLVDHGRSVSAGSDISAADTCRRSEKDFLGTDLRQFIARY